MMRILHCIPVEFLARIPKSLARSQKRAVSSSVCPQHNSTTFTHPPPPFHPLFDSNSMNIMITIGRETEISSAQSVTPQVNRGQKTGKNRSKLSFSKNSVFKLSWARLALYSIVWQNKRGFIYAWTERWHFSGKCWITTMIGWVEVKATAPRRRRQCRCLRRGATFVNPKCSVC